MAGPQRGPLASFERLNSTMREVGWHKTDLNYLVYQELQNLKALKCFTVELFIIVFNQQQTPS
jgi:hypothetical protein